MSEHSVEKLKLMSASQIDKVKTYMIFELILKSDNESSSYKELKGNKQ